MREIKFRAWDGDRMRYDVTGLEHGIKNEMAGVFLDGEYWSLSGETLTAAIDERHAVLMQFTGRHDKNGVEIYEGDILKEPVSPVGGKDGGYLRMNRVIEWLGSESGYSLFASEAASIIVGNIYENPDLLSDEQ